MKYEVVNIKDGTRLSRAMPKGSSTLFVSEQEASEWMKQKDVSDKDYSVKEAQ